jgi:hypothetical protein
MMGVAGLILLIGAAAGGGGWAAGAGVVALLIAGGLAVGLILARALMIVVPLVAGGVVCTLMLAFAADVVTPVRVVMAFVMLLITLVSMILLTNRQCPRNLLFGSAGAGAASLLVLMAITPAVAANEEAWQAVRAGMGFEQKRVEEAFTAPEPVATPEPNDQNIAEVEPIEPVDPPEPEPVQPARPRSWRDAMAEQGFSVTFPNPAAVNFEYEDREVIDRVLPRHAYRYQGDGYTCSAYLYENTRPAHLDPGNAELKRLAHDVARDFAGDLQYEMWRTGAGPKVYYVRLHIPRNDGRWIGRVESRRVGPNVLVLASSFKHRDDEATGRSRHFFDSLKVDER